MNTWLTPFQYDYMLTALWTSTLIGGVCGLLSGFITLKGWSLMGDALSHAVVPGVALAYLAGLPFSVGAFTSGLLAAGAMAFIKMKTPVREDAVIGIVFTSFFALGLLLISIFPSRVDLKSIIFGNILGIAPADVLQVVIVSAICLLVIALKWRDLLLFCFDPSQARALGLPVGFLHVLLLLLLSATAVAALQAVGAILVIAVLVTPGATAYLLTDRFGVLLLLGAAIGASTAFVGAYASYFLNGETGGCIVTLQTLVFLGALIFAPKHGLLAGRRARRLANTTP
ncbi:MAG: metal ABC transporter permease [Opitutus sp.]|nr:metal ABC transporter permease [Opitutus sp.]MCS6248708.1 metal ABC transporter permease [Opitutus sp.]MCS6274215.1 metal ABC transporter permease [Opitutus sp.]MCS6277116.1 metal ABC transporter permease [Opitutus sp.]MCS6300238.1 metal ABC transporter permease [Opitutus sp.]